MAKAKDPHKKSAVSKIYFWLFIMMAILAAFLFWSARNDAFINKDSPVGVNISFFAAIIATMLAILFGLFTFVRFIRSRSIAGGLFLTTSISTGVFLGSSQIIGAVIPPTAGALSASPEAVNSGVTAVVGLAQIGLFALWFLFLLFTIYIQVSPVKKIDKTLQKIIDGEEVRRLRIGKSKQYRGIEEKLRTISTDAQTRREKELEAIKLQEQKRAQARARREAKKEQHPGLVNL